MSVTMQDIAMLAGVSRQAVSAVLNRSAHSRVSEATRERILKLARELNYVPNPAARSLSGGTTNTIGFFGGLFSPYGVQSALLAEISGALRSEGYHVIGGHYAFGDTEDTTRHLGQFISRGVDAIMVCGLEHSRRAFNRVMSVPYVLCSPHAAGTDFDVGVDTVQAGYMATRHLVEHGHCRIAYLRISPHEAGHRASGWRQASREAGVDDADRFVLTLRDLDGNADAVLGELRRLKVTAVFAQNDYVAAKLTAALIQRGVKVPDDVAIVGFDGCSFADFCPVPLTTVIQPIRRQAEAATRLLLDRIEKGEAKTQAAGIAIEPLLYCGGSCGCQPQPIDKLYRINSPNTLELDYRLNFGIDIEDIGSQP